VKKHYVNGWSEEELNRLRAWYPVTDAGEIARGLGRLKGGVQSKAHELGLRKNRRRGINPSAPAKAKAGGTGDKSKDRSRAEDAGAETPALPPDISEGFEGIDCGDAGGYGESQLLRSNALTVLEKVKADELKKGRTPIRVNAKTVIYAEKGREQEAIDRYLSRGKMDDK
jgi:hypothetical protein